MTASKYDWESDYVGAVLETDNEKLAIRIAVAKAVVLTRVERLNTHNEEAKDERASLAAALIGLRKLKSERLNGCILDGELSI